MLSEKPTALLKLWCKNKIKGIAINPENEIALPMLTRSMMIRLEGFRKNWKKISDKREVKITITIFIIKSLKTRLYILNTFKNSMGTNKTNNAIQNRIKNQNKPCAFHVIVFLSTRPVDSRSK